MTMPATGAPTTPFETTRHPQVSLHDYLTADVAAPVESIAWLAFQAALDHEEEAAALAPA